jgi:hypothetical protein
MTQAQNSAAKYFDLHASGIGYISRVREVQPKKGAAFTAVTIAALHGDSDDVQYTYFDCRVSGGLARQCVQQLKNDFFAEKKVLISFKIGDFYPEAFESKGKTLCGLKGRLLKVEWAKVDGVNVELPQPTQTETEHPETNSEPIAA